MNTEHVFREDSSMARTAMPEDKKLNSFGAAIKKYRTAAGYSQQELADTMNITRHAVYCWENNSARPDIETIRELTRLLDIPLYELFDLSSDNTDADENRVLGYFRQLNDTGRKITMSFLKNLVRYEGRPKETKIIKADFGRMSYESTAAAAGPGCEYSDAPREYRFVRKNDLNRHADTIIRVSGCSMEPQYHDGDLVYVKSSDSADDGDIVICTSADGAVIKQKRGNRLFSLNKNLPYGKKSEDDTGRIQGIVLGTVNPDDFASTEEVNVLEELFQDEDDGHEDESNES